MAPIAIAFVVNFSSQDDNFPAENLLYGNRRWQSAPDAKESTLEVELQFAQSSKITHIDIGNYGSANVRVQVGRSSWPRDREFVTFLPTVFLMTPLESRQNENKCAVRMFSEKHFDERNKLEMWDRVRILCHQPYRRDAFGLSFVKFHAFDDNTNDSGFSGTPNSEDNRIDSTRDGHLNRLTTIKTEPDPSQNARSRSSRIVLMSSPRSVSSMDILDRNRDIGNRSSDQVSPSINNNSSPIINTTRKRRLSDQSNELNTSRRRFTIDSEENFAVTRPGPSNERETNVNMQAANDHQTLVSCPICNKDIRKSYIEVHANLCLDFSD